MHTRAIFFVRGVTFRAAARQLPADGLAIKFKVKDSRKRAKLGLALGKQRHRRARSLPRFISARFVSVIVICHSFRTFTTYVTQPSCEKVSINSTPRIN